MKPVVRAFIFDTEGQILMARHKPDTPWVLPGGHVEPGEALHEAIKREIQEEFGIQAEPFEIDREEVLTHRWRKLRSHALPIASYDIEYRNSEWKDQSRTEYIFLMETHDTIKNIQTEEISEYKWHDPEDILTMKPNIDTWDFYIEILEKIIGEENFEE